MFECLIDGFMVLETGTEAPRIDENGIYGPDIRFVQGVNNLVNGWKPIIHFDVKLENSE